MTAGDGGRAPQVFNVLRGEALERRSTPFGEVGTVFSGSGLELVWVSKQADATVFRCRVPGPLSPRSGAAKVLAGHETEPGREEPAKRQRSPGKEKPGQREAPGLLPHRPAWGRPSRGPAGRGRSPGGPVSAVYSPTAALGGTRTASLERLVRRPVTCAQALAGALHGTAAS